MHTYTSGPGCTGHVKSDRNFSRTAPANPFIRSPNPLSSLSLSLSLPPPFSFSFSHSLSSAHAASTLSLAIGAAMYTPGRIYRPVFQPPCGGNGFRNAADTARPVLITIHTYCPHILPISPRTLPLATDYITTYGEHKLLWLPFYRRPSTSSSSTSSTSSSSFSTDHLSRATHLTTGCLFLSPSPPPLIHSPFSLRFFPPFPLRGRSRSSFIHLLFVIYFSQKGGGRRGRSVSSFEFDPPPPLLLSFSSKSYTQFI